MGPKRVALTRERILDTALVLFAEQGYEATTTREITDRLGVTPGSLYYYFDSKADCLAALVSPYLDAVDTAIDRHRTPSGLAGDARAFLSDYSQILVAHVAIARLVDDDPAVANHPDLAPRIAAVTEGLRTLLAGPDPDEATLVRASATLGAVRRPAMRLPDIVEANGPVAIDAALAALQPNS